MSNRCRNLIFGGSRNWRLRGGLRGSLGGTLRDCGWVRVDHLAHPDVNQRASKRENHARDKRDNDFDQFRRFHVPSQYMWKRSAVALRFGKDS